MNRALPRLQKRDSTEVFKCRKPSRQIEQSSRLKDTQISPQTPIFHPKHHKSPKLQGAENLFSRRTDFFRKVNEIYFHSEQNFSSPVFGPKSGIFSDLLLKNTTALFSIPQKTKLNFEPEKRWF
ncbi:MAG: hypothetical protein NC252_05270 [Roseburia sp.]|nr:hypothetical protein [Roseburia sp.]MCM1421327.1 hypothetical protein [Bacteroides sp.]